MLVGNDVSVFQGQIDWDTFKKNANFAIIRSSYGNGYADTKFLKNRDEARRIGLPHGFYHYAYPQYNQPQAEADWFLTTLANIRNGEFLALDFEERYADPVTWSKAFLDHIALRLNGYKPLLYINYALLQAHDWSSVANAGYGLWLAEWNGLPDKTSPLKDWNVCAFHQWTDKQTVPGILGNVDGDAFFGDLTALAAYGYKIPVLPTPQPEYEGFYLAVKKVMASNIFPWQKTKNINDLIKQVGV
jgi:lysozyme